SRPQGGNGQTAVNCGNFPLRTATNATVHPCAGKSIVAGNVAGRLRIAVNAYGRKSAPFHGGDRGSNHRGDAIEYSTDGSLRRAVCRFGLPPPAVPAVARPRKWRRGLQNAILRHPVRRVILAGMTILHDRVVDAHGGEAVSRPKAFETVLAGR